MQEKENLVARYSAVLSWPKNSAVFGALNQGVALNLLQARDPQKNAQGSISYK